MCFVFLEVGERLDPVPTKFARARNAGRPALVELRTSPEAITPRLTIDMIRKAL